MAGAGFDAVLGAGFDALLGVLRKVPDLMLCPGCCVRCGALLCGVGLGHSWVLDILRGADGAGRNAAAVARMVGAVLGAGHFSVVWSNDMVGCWTYSVVLTELMLLWFRW